MRYVSIDIEATGLDFEKDQLLSVGLVIEDTNNVLPLDDLPRLEIRVVRERLSGNTFALNMNKYLIEDILKKTERPNTVYCQEAQVSGIIYQFLAENGAVSGTGDRINVAGKNFTGYDLRFLEQLPSWGEWFRAGRRVMDPALEMVDWSIDKELPNLSLCKSRAGLPPVVSHNAVEDAIDVISVLRFATKNYTDGYQTD